MTELAKRPEDMTRDELIELLGTVGEGGIKISFSGKENAKRIARKVQPRTSRRIAKYSVGSEEEQARNPTSEVPSWLGYCWYRQPQFPLPGGRFRGPPPAQLKPPLE